MAFPQGPRRVSPTRATSSVFAIGRRVYVARSAHDAAGVVLTREDGKTPVGVLADGIELALLAWRPRPGDGTRYHVRAVATGVEGWIGAGNLRATAVAAAPAAVTTRPAGAAAPERSGVARDPKRPFGQSG